MRNSLFLYHNSVWTIRETYLDREATQSYYQQNGLHRSGCTYDSELSADKKNQIKANLGQPKVNSKQQIQILLSFHCFTDNILTNALRNDFQTFILPLCCADEKICVFPLFVHSLFFADKIQTAGVFVYSCIMLIRFRQQGHFRFRQQGHLSTPVLC